jgi:asparagine synthase (glutamine-hydrolysing)
MLKTIEHRGPDDNGFYIDDWGAIGMQRLSIIDLHTGHQPIFSADKRYAIVFNGEIYNYRDLRRSLLKSGYHFQTETDTEVILAMYINEGPKCVQQFNGMFAFAIYDHLQHELFLARDRFGIKPLYYSKAPYYFAFASELKALFQFPLIDRDLDLEALDYYLTMESVPAPFSIIKSIKKLMPGEYMIINQNGSIKTQYYDIRFRPKHEGLSDFDKKMELERLLNDAVKARMVSDVPIGAFLSGGIDSSLVAHYLQKNSFEQINTFSIGFEEKSFDESMYAEKVANHLGTKHHLAMFNTSNLLDLLPKITDLLDEPFADASLIPTFLLSQFTRNQVKVALSGDGSDELFGGYPTYYARKMGDRIPCFLGAPIAFFTNMLPVSNNNMSFDFKAKKFAAGLTYDPDLRHLMWLGAFDTAEKKRVLLPQYQFRRKDYEFPILDYHMRNCDAEDNWERSLYIDMRFYLQDNMLVKVDRASMYNSLEVRVPFLDHSVAEFAMRLPANDKYRGNQSKYLLKNLALMYLPEEIVMRPKKGFGIPLSKWIRDELKPLFNHYLNRERIKNQGIFNPDYVDKLFLQHLKLKKDNRKQLYTLLIFQIWYDKFFQI